MLISCTAAQAQRITPRPNTLSKEGGLHSRINKTKSMPDDALRQHLIRAAMQPFDAMQHLIRGSDISVNNNNNI